MANVKIKKAVLDNLAAGYSHHHESKKQNSNYDKLEQIVEKQVSERLNVICEGNLSGSILILGSEDRDQFINKVIKKNEYLKKSPVVYISGLSCQSENQAMFQIADAFLLRNNAERNPNIVLEDLEIFFRQRKMESSPAVIVIDHIHEFAKRESSKQVLIYTLLDLMHKPDMFFVLVGMTPCFHLHMLLERRVVSRLNAQTVFLNAGSPVDICSLLSVRLQLEYDEDSIFSTQEEVVQLLNYNKSVSTLFGDFIQEDKKGVGILYGLIECYVNWGYTAE